MATETLPFDVLNYVRNDQDLAGYLREMLEADDLSVTALAIDTVERAKALPHDPSLDLAGRLYRVAHSVGLRLTAVPSKPRAA